MPDPITLTATASNGGLTWTTAPYYPADYSNPYDQSFVVVPDSGSFPDPSTYQSVTVTASDSSNGSDLASALVNGTITTSQVPLGITITPPAHHNNFGAGLNLTVILVYDSSLTP
jgi:hypothetical protein